ncbi:hypothetical protein PSTEL_02900 [Paenibacillus stellifer]|uniref:ABC transporter permease n=1 Tax=Paenibacillus stellifer TaxID=169760 RepID=A0A089N0M4_9BACL|nr:hypothetical protein [Paenibacillus stellifer]AIQ62219.1 hypothetical protein PSTEL_02900 [Paenibacillus stellifer]
MQTLKDSWFILRGDYRGNKMMLLFQLLFSIIFMGYLGAFAAMTINDSLKAGERMVITDYLLLALTPAIGFTYCRNTMKYWSTNSYTKLLAYLTSLPIPVRVILCKRRLQALLTFFFNGLLFFGILYGVGVHLREALSLPSYLVFALTWTGYGIVLTGLYIYFEYTVSGKAYFWLVLLMMVAALGVALLIRLAGGNLLLYTVSNAKSHGFLSPLMWGALLGGGLSLWLFSRLTVYRLKSRDLV